MMPTYDITNALHVLLPDRTTYMYEEIGLRDSGTDRQTDSVTASN